jgi:hypothetical protein
MSDDLEAARARRTAMIAELTACVCAYPLARFRNLSGHDDDCPAHALFRARHGLTSSPRKDSAR